MNKKLRILISSAAASFTMAVAGFAIAGAAPQDAPNCPDGSHVQGNNCKVTICHRTDSVTNPYVKEDVDISSVDGNAANDNGQGDHLLEHTGPVAASQTLAQQLKDNNEKWGDIIPALAGISSGLNWTAEGQAIYNNECNFVTGGRGGEETPPTTTTTTTPTTGGRGGAVAQVTQTPQGGVGAGEGGGSVAYSTVSVVGLSGSIFALGSGLAWFNRRKSLLS